MESVESKEERKKTYEKFRQEIYSNVIRAGKRTYFFDVKSTRNDEYYLTITESKKKYSENGKFHYEKHKVFLYREDFDKFTENLQEVIDFIKNAVQNQEPHEHAEVGAEVENTNKENYSSDVNFDDLGDQKE